MIARLRVVNLSSRLAGPFDLCLAAGECLAISAPSGAGKSLFLRMIADLDPNEGEVFHDGTERRSMTAPGDDAPFIAPPNQARGAKTLLGTCQPRFGFRP